MFIRQVHQGLAADVAGVIRCDRDHDQLATGLQLAGPVTEKPLPVLACLLSVSLPHPLSGSLGVDVIRYAACNLAQPVHRDGGPTKREETIREDAFVERFSRRKCEAILYATQVTLRRGLD